MRFFNKQVFIGLGAGVVLAIAVVVLVGYVSVKRMMPNTEMMAQMLQPPKFPSGDQVSVYEKTDAWSIRPLGGTTVNLSHFKGNVVFLNFWATWCQPCAIEMPSIQNLYDELKDENVVFLLITNENETTVRTFFETKQYSFPVYLSAGNTPGVFASPVIPATFILDRDGAIAFEHMGSAKWDDASCLRFLRSLNG